MSALPVPRPDSFAPAVAEQLEADALDAIAQVHEPEDAEALLIRVKLAEQAVRLSQLGRDYERRWGRVRLLAERRYGELLGPAKTREESGAVRGTDTTPAEREAKSQARKIAAVPEPVFTEYVEATETPTRAGLLRHAEPKTPEESPVEAVQTKRDQMRANAHARRFTDLIAGLRGYADGIENLDIDRIRAAMEPAELDEWTRSLSDSLNKLRRFRTDLQEGRN